MTEDAVGVCSILNPQLPEALIVPSAASTVAQSDGTLYLNSSMTVDGSCLYTTADLASSFPEGTVLQILPDSTILAVPPLKDLSNHNLNNTTIIFKDPSLIGELSSSQSTMPPSNLLVESENQNGLQMSDVPICSEANISDIDLSFLTETVESISTTASKALNDATMKELQGTITDQSLEVLESDSSNNLQVNEELVQSLSDSPKESDEPAEDVVMIDVSKPIQLSQNSLIMVNGQKCVLQQTQSGQVVAYPVKEQVKPRRRRGRPRKASIEQVSNDTSLDASFEAENASDDEREQGLLEIVNDDGSLVRRSTRRRKKTKVLKDYETGNLKQELGSDIDEGDIIEIDTDLSRKRKLKGPGRPRKHPLPESIGIKRNRGRPRKQVLENEPTQAFLVQTADGQTLMMQVPLSSIPPGVSLQEVAQNIANRLNVGLGHTQTNSTETVNILQPPTSNQNLESSELAVQDHSIGSTTNLCNIEQFQITENNANDSGQTISTDMDDIVIDSVSDSEVIEVTLKSVNERNVQDNHPEGFLLQNILQNQAQYTNLETPQSPQDNFSLNVPTSISSTTDLSTFTRLTNQICMSKADDQDLDSNYNQFQIPKDFLISGDFMKGKMNLQDLLENVSSNAESTVKTDEMGNRGNGSLIPQVEYSLNTSDELKEFEEDLATQIMDNEKRLEQKEMSREASNLEKTETISSNYDFLTRELSNSILVSNTEKISVPNEAIISSIKHDHNLLIDSTRIPDVKKSSNRFDKSEALKSRISAIKQAFHPILPLKKISPNLETTSDSPIFSVPAMAVVPVSSDQQLQLSEKLLPIILPTQDLTGSMKCKICQRFYFTEEELIKHFRAEHPKCICKQCDYMSEFSCVIKRHSIRHVENGIVCEICGKHYKDHYILKMHVKLVHLPAEVVFTCEVCEKKFTRKAHLKRHLRIHQPNKPYKCAFCNYRGCEKSDITKHILIHESPKHTCHICGKAFRHIKNKDLHLKRHFKQRDYKCGICNFYGYTFTDIRKHIERRHSDAKSSTCLDCGTTFKNKDMLEEHKSSGECEMDSTEGPSVKKELKEIKQESSVLEDMSLEFLETEQSEEPSPAENDCSQYKASSLPPGQLLMNSDNILSAHKGQILLNGLEGTEFLSSESLPFLNVGSDSSKLITLITNHGKNYALPLKDSSEASEVADCAATSTNNKVETLFLSAFREDENT